MKKVEFKVIFDPEAQREKEEVLQKLLKSSIVKEWMQKYGQNTSFIERHTYKFKTYVEQKQICENCPGLTSCMQPSKGHILELEYDSVLSKKICACKYLREKEEKLAHHKNFLLCDMSEEQLQLSFNQIDFAYEKKVHPSYCRVVIEMMEALKNGSNEGFYLCGEPGTGKTFLACCYVNAMAKKGKKCAFVNVSNYFADLKAKMYDKDAFAKEIDALKKAEVLVLDDIGGESVSMWSRDEILLSILNERMEKHLITLFTSNYDMKNLEKYYAANSKLVNDQVGAKRLLERMKSLSFEKVLICCNRREKKVEI